MVSPLNNVFTFRNAHTCLQCAAYQARGGSNFPRQMTLAFRMQKPTAKESLEYVIRETPVSIRKNIFQFILFLKKTWTNNDYLASKKCNPLRSNEVTRHIRLRGAHAECRILQERAQS
jgi:hypothetical protein